MYMRLVQARFIPASLTIIKKIYDDKIIPQLQNMKGCIFASLIKSETEPDEGISLTIWDSEENAESYAKSGAFQALIDEIRPYFSDSSEWKVRLTRDLKVEYQPVRDEPVIKSYRTVMESSTESPTGEAMYMRILSLNIKPDKMSEFEAIYAKEVLPALKEVPGCKYAYLTTSVESTNEAISITIWDSMESAADYEKESFKGLLAKAKHTLSDLYQWKMSLEQEEKWQITTSDDLSVKFYSVVSGRGFKQQ